MRIAPIYCRAALFVWAGLLFLLPAMTALPDEPLHADVLPSGARFRSHAPTPLEVRLLWKGSGLLEGLLDITLMDLGEPVLHQRTQPLALVSGTKNLRIMLPPVSHTFYGHEAEVALKFVSRDRTVNLGRFPVPMSGDTQRTFVIAIGREAVQGEQRRSSVWQSLRLERFVPAEKRGATLSLATSPAYLGAEDFPLEPLAYCAYDIVLIEEEAFRHLREKQLSALSRWTGAGGSLCIITGESVPEPQEKFLRELAADETSASHAAPAGDLPGSAGRMPAPQTPALWRYGLGRVAVLSHLPDAAGDFDSLSWRRMAVFLWKMRADEARRCIETGEWSSSFEIPRLAGKAAAHRGDLSGLLDALLPKTSRPLPYPIIGAVLALFLLIIGPVDYLALGWLRRRRWTWALFPCVCVAFTALLLKLANDFMGSNDRKATVTIADIGRGGRMLRSTSLELLLPARTRENSIESRHTWTSILASSDPYRRESHPGEIPSFEGQAPEHYILHTSVRQWTKSYLRTASLAPEGAGAGILWDAFDAALLAKHSYVRYSGIIAGGGVEDTVLRMRGASEYSFVFIHPSESKEPFPDPQRSANSGENAGVAFDLAAVRNLGNSLLSLLFSHRSPEGGESLEDMGIEDSSDPRQWIVIAWKLSGSDLQIFRRVYFTHD